MSTSVAQQEIGFVKHSRAESIDLRWTRFLSEHPNALVEFREIARELLDGGETRLSAKFLIEIARYKHIVRRSPGDAFAINNDFSSRLARALEVAYPDLHGKFEKRELISLREVD